MSAGIYRRPRKDGTHALQVKWRDSVAGRQQSETFDGSQAALAAEFRDAVIASGDTWPEGWVRGEGWRHTTVPRRTLDQVFDSWVEWQQARVQKNRLNGHTLHRYRRDYENHIRHPLGGLDFARLGSVDIDAWLLEMLEERATKTVINIYKGVLAPVIRHGVQRLRLRSDNPCEGVEAPRPDPSSKQVKFLQKDDWEVLRASLRPDVHDLVDTLLATGLRWGEATALRAQDVSTGADGLVVLHVRHAWSRRAPTGSDGIWTLSHPKMGRERSVVVSGDLADRLRRRRADRSPDQWLFSTRSGGPWRHSDFLTDRWYPAVELAREFGLTRHVTPHMLRHTAVVWALHAGVSIDLVSHMLGHSSIKTTYDIYGGVLNLTDDRMAQALAEAMRSHANVAVPAPELVASLPIRPGPRGRTRPRSRLSA